ncbi:MAG: hypothetical protein R6W89_12535 [Candidatus Hydrogenedentota bacterium]
MSKGEQDTTSEPNPLDLPNKIMRKLKRCSEVQEEFEKEKIRYLWMHVCKEEANGDNEGERSDAESLALDEWLNIVDESAALGAQSVIISAGSSLADRPEVWAICQWAQDIHEMLVAVYVYSGAIPLAPGELDALAKLDTSKLRVVANKDDVSKLEGVNERGIPLYGVETVRPQKEERTPCDLPFNMTCVESHGNLYTCGLVLDDEHYWLGNACEKRLDALPQDKHPPHQAPSEKVVRDRQLCNTCPRMIERILGKDNGQIM